MNGLSQKTIPTRTLLSFALLTSVSTTVIADWMPYRNIKLEGLANTIPGGTPNTQVSIPAGVYRFRIDPDSTGVDYATKQFGNTRSKSASLMIYTGTSKNDNTSTVTYYGLNSDNFLASSVIHALPLQGGFSTFLSDWVRVDNSGSVIVVVEKWED